MRRVFSNEQKSNRFAAGVLFLTAANLIVKILGLFFKIPLVRLLGDSGMGYFNAAYTVYSFFYLLSTAGLPAALSILLSERLAAGDGAGAKSIFRRSLLCFTLIGLLFSCILYLSADFFAGLIGNPGAGGCVRRIAPVLLLSCVISVFRGYFQGQKNMLPTALSQVTEAGGKLLFGLLLGANAVKAGLEPAKAAEAAVGGIVLAELCAALLTVFWKRRQFPNGNITVPEKESSSLRRLLSVAIPITASATVMSLTNVVDLMTMMRRLQAAGYSMEQANALYGNYTGLAVPMFNLPPVLIYPIASAILPYISGSLAGGDRAGAKGYLSVSVRYAILLGMPCAAGLSVFAEEILKLLYPAASAETAAPMLTLLAPSCLFVGLMAVGNAGLQAYGHPGVPILSMGLGGAVKLIAGYFLIGRFGMIGVPIGTLLCYLTAVIGNMAFLARKAGNLFRWKELLLSFCATALCMGSVWGVRVVLVDLTGEEKAWQILPAIAFGAVVYGVLLLWWGLLDREQIEKWKNKIQNKGKQDERRNREVCRERTVCDR